MPWSLYNETYQSLCGVGNDSPVYYNANQPDAQIQYALLEMLLSLDKVWQWSSREFGVNLCLWWFTAEKLHVNHQNKNWVKDLHALCPFSAKYHWFLEHSKSHVVHGITDFESFSIMTQTTIPLCYDTDHAICLCFCISLHKESLIPLNFSELAYRDKSVESRDKSVEFTVSLYGKLTKKQRKEQTWIIPPAFTVWSICALWKLSFLLVLCMD